MPYNEDLAKRIRAHLGQLHGLEEKSMFGGIGFLVNGNMACGVHRDSLIVRLDAAAYAAALKQPHVKVFDMTGRPMKGWITVSAGGYSTVRGLGKWLDKSIEFAKSLPPK
jgi:TfoX/Sxy family transcriptional regulator of competence genes